ncbi:aromatic ring-hydroxylating oxygenase subunit alpha [Streptomyces formicae]|uniref:Phenylpropionate dioxygenase-related ring-hydroxylating dioxygenase, large terminal subunit n=1 Tax=Streptomyces formicae TaxID=1616117 RepID=A0A291QM92_9ACTN|nr:aromatic ring-hydroxylating dioxygenase subunit alpha [Streptomyces formicae]ATL32604.1 Phenylpropionate dioxygenase-related ring-hydroxylating dioxygenase, large terminal subunit [Streptomyces formicae]
MKSSWDGTRYTSAQVLAHERHDIFERHWICAGRTKDLSRPGSFLRADAGTESVLLVRGRDGELRGLLNLCRHRGARLCVEREGDLGSSLRCMYHGWTYGLDGRLTGAPHLREVLQEGEGEGRLDLHAVAAEEWLGYAWVSLATAAAPLAEQMEPQLVHRLGSADALDEYTIDDLVAVDSRIYDVRANWKMIFENFSECYHCPTLHPELSAALPHFRTGYGTISGPVGQGARLADHMTGFSLSGKAAAAPLPRLSVESHRTFNSVNLWPNTVLVLLPDHVVCFRVEPRAPDRTIVTADWLFHPQAAAAPGFDPDDAITLLDIANRQDFEASERVQLGASSAHFSSVYPPHEHVIGDFHRWVDDALGTRARSGEPSAVAGERGRT